MPGHEPEAARGRVGDTPVEPVEHRPQLTRSCCGLPSTSTLRSPVTVAIARTKMSSVLEPLRAGEWWEHKLAPMLGTGYMTAFHLRSSLFALWPTFVATLVGMAAAAAYVSLINDLADLDEDAAAGKYNRLAQRRRLYAYTAL